MENYILRIADKYFQGHEGSDGGDAERIRVVGKSDADLSSSLLKFFNHVELLRVYNFLKNPKSGGYQGRMYYCTKDKKLENPELKDIKEIADEKKKIVEVFGLEELV